MCVRSGWMSSTYSGPHTSASSLRWVISRPRLRTSTRSRSNSIGVRWTGSPSRRTTRAARSISRPSTTTVGSSSLGRRAAQRRLQARHQLARAERLGDVVVGARLERAHLLLLLAHRREHQDRHLAPLPQPARHLHAVSVREHQVDDRRLRRAHARRGRAPRPPSLPAPPRSPPRAGPPSARARSAARRRRPAPAAAAPAARLLGALDGRVARARRPILGTARRSPQRQLEHERRALPRQRLDVQRSRRSPR